MIQKLFNGIAQKLNESYPSHMVYIDDVEQDFTEPCFYISLLSSSISPMREGRFTLECLFDIKYFPEAKNTELSNEVAWGLYEILQMLCIDAAFVRGIRMNHNIEDSITHFLVVYKMSLMKEMYQEAMEDITVKPGLGG